MTKTPTGFNYVRHRLYPRMRHRKSIAKFLAAEVTALAASATGQTVAPVRTVNTKAEALVVMGSQPSNNDTLTIGNFTYTFKTALTETKAARTLTGDGTNITAADTVVIGGQTYTFKTALTEVKASGDLVTDNTNAANGATVVIGTRTYTFQTVLTNVAGNVLIGTDADASLLNLARAINLTGTPGTDYATLTTIHPVVGSSASVTAHTITLTAKAVGTAGNVATTASSSPASHITPTAATLTGGVNAVANEVFRGASAAASLTNLFEAINAGANGGVDYSSTTVANASVDATNPSGTTVVATAKLVGVAGNSIAVTEASTHLSWAGATLTGGVAAAANQVLRGADAAASLANVIKAINDSGTEGTHYSTGTVVHDKVVASAATNDLLLTAASAANVIPGQSVPLAKSSSALTLPTLAQLDGPGWTATSHAYTDGEGPVLITTATTRPAGTPLTGLFVHVINTNRVAFATSREALRKGNFIQTTDAGTGTHTATRDVTASGVFGLLAKNKPRTVAAATDVDSLR